MNGASPEKKVDALREFIKGLEHFGGGTCWETEGQDESLRDPDNCRKCRLEDMAKEVEQHVTLAQQAAYERAAQIAKSYDRGDEDTVDAACIAEAIERLMGGSASALELALAQRQLEEAEYWYEMLDSGGDGRLAELRACIAALSGQKEAK